MANTKASGNARRTISKTGMITDIASATDLPKRTVKQVVEAMFNIDYGVIPAYLRAGDRVSIAGFGRFEAKHRPARMGRNPATGDAIKIPAKWVVKAAIAKPLRDAVMAALERKGKSKLPR